MEPPRSFRSTRKKDSGGLLGSPSYDGGAKGSRFVDGVRQDPGIEWIGFQSGQVSGVTVPLGCGAGTARLQWNHSAVGTITDRRQRLGLSPQGKGPNRGGSTHPSLGSRPAEPGAPDCFVGARFDLSSIAEFDSKHRALALRRRGLDRHRRPGAGTRRSSRPTRRLKGMWSSHPFQTRLEGAPQLKRLVRTGSGARVDFLGGRTPAAWRSAHHTLLQHSGVGSGVTAARWQSASEVPIAALTS